MCAAILCALMLAAVPVASAQDQAAVSQYLAQQPTAGGSGSGAGGGGSDEVLGAQGSRGAAGNAGEVAQAGGGGSLPFTGYPLTSYLWIVISFVLAGLCVRLASTAAYRRRRASEPQRS